jgi:two-component system, NarL family, response regulator LiaR
LGRVNVPNNVNNPLSPRELDILELIADRLSNKLNAERLAISVATVKTHVEEILSKLSASDRTQAAVKALREGIT